MDSENEKFVDQLLAASLDRFATIEPRAGLEGRILAGVAARHRSAHRRSWTLGLAVSALAVVAVVFAVQFSRRPSLPESQPTSLAGTRSQPAALPAPNVPERIPVRRPRVSSALAERPQQFPTPAPLSEQEKLLLLYVKEAPRPMLAAPPSQADKDLAIPDLRIAALGVTDQPRPNPAR